MHIFRKHLALIIIFSHLLTISAYAQDTGRNTESNNKQVPYFDQMNNLQNYFNEYGIFFDLDISSKTLYIDDHIITYSYDHEKENLVVELDDINYPISKQLNYYFELYQTDKPEAEEYLQILSKELGLNLFIDKESRCRAVTNSYQYYVKWEMLGFGVALGAMMTWALLCAITKSVHLCGFALIPASIVALGGYVYSSVYTPKVKEYEILAQRYCN
ncbi:MAG: hypothetical protein ABIA04_05175 [Pseudomonadota bacterium]